MTDLATVAPAFVEMAHRIVWASVATVDTDGRPRSRVLHPLWTWDGSSSGMVVATGARNQRMMSVMCCTSFQVWVAGGAPGALCL